MPTVLDWLLKKFPTAKRMTLKRMVEDGRVLVNGRAAGKLKQEVAESEEIRLVDQFVSQPARPQGPPFRIVYEDGDILVIDKPSGLLTSSVPREKRATAWALVRRHLAESDPGAKAGLIHRLDKDAAGLLVFSKNNAAFESLKQQFFRHDVERIYTALVHGQPPQLQGRIESNLVEYPDGSVHSTQKPGAGESASTHYIVMRKIGRMTLLRVTLHTGRKHQIRAHLSELGHPIVGDTVYGKVRATTPLMLVATELAVTHPRTGQRMEFKLPLPAAMRKLAAEDKAGEDKAKELK